MPTTVAPEAGAESEVSVCRWSPASCCSPSEPALVSLALVAVVACTLIAYEAIHFRDVRARIRGERAR